MDRPLRRWTRPLRFFRLEALFSSRPPRRTSDRPAARPRLEVLEDRVGPGEATSGVVAAVLGVSVLDPAAAGLALFGLTPLSPLADPPLTQATRAESAESTPTSPPIDPVGPTPQQPGGGAAAPVVMAPAMAEAPVPTDGDPFAPLLDTFWAPFAPTASRPALTAPAASEPSAAPAAAPATSGGSAEGAAAAEAAGSAAATGESAAPAPADIQPLRFAPPSPGPVLPAPLVAAAAPAKGTVTTLTVAAEDTSGPMARTASYGSSTFGESGGSGEQSVVTLAVTGPDAWEGGFGGSFTFGRSGGLDQGLTVPIWVGGTATAGSDYTGLGGGYGSVSFAPYQTQVVVSVTALSDGLSEGNETVEVIIQPWSGGSGGYQVSGPSGGSLTIHDASGGSGGSGGESLVSVTATDRDASESGDSGQFTFSRSGGLDQWLTVGYRVGGSATAGSDYATLSGTVSFAPYQTAVTVGVSPLADALTEGDETVSVTIQAGAGYLVGSPSQDSVTLHDYSGGSGGQPTVTVTASAPDAWEGGSGGAFRFSRSGGDLSLGLTVACWVGGSATPTSDYPDLNGGAACVSFGAYQTQVVWTVTPSADGLAEGDETVQVVLQPDPMGLGGYTVGSPSGGTITIHDGSGGSGGEAVITLTVSAPDAVEGGNPGAFTLTRSGGQLDQGLSVSWWVGGTATAGSDYSGLTSGYGGVSFAPYQTQVIVSVTALAETLTEGDETVEVIIQPWSGGSGGYQVSNPSGGSLTIHDVSGGGPTVTVTASDASASENGDDGAFTFARTGDLTQPLTVYYDLGGTASPAADYGWLHGETGSVTFGGGAATATLTLTAYPDGVSEGDETVVLTLTAGGSGGSGGYAIGSPSAGTVVLHDGSGGSGGAPTVNLNGPSAVNEGQTRHYTFTTSDPDPQDTFSLVTPAADSGGSGGVANLQFDPITGAGSCDLTFPDGPATQAVSVQVQDAAGHLSNTATVQVTVANLPPIGSLAGPAEVTYGTSAAFDLTGVSDVAADLPTLHYSFALTEAGLAATYTAATDGSRTAFSGLAVGTHAIYARVYDKDQGYAQYSRSLTVTPRVLTVTAAAADKVYDGGTSAAVTLSDDRISGDLLTITYAAATFVDKTVGIDKAVAVTGISLSGPAAGNYTLTSTTASATADITPARLTITAKSRGKACGEAVTFAGSEFTTSELLAGDNVTGVTLSSPGAPAAAAPGIYCQRAL